ncbi:MAG: serine/threonine-protein kinase, partial [Cyanobacteria bacterium P01_D01_bin.73]
MFEPGQVVGDRYQLEGQLGSNESRQTWLAKDKESEALVTLKLLALSGLTQWNDVKLLEREAETLKALRHPQLPKFRDYVTLPDQAGWFALVTDYIPGVSLKEKLQQRHRFSLKSIEAIAGSTLKILHYLHRHRPPILHRDIKPSNLIAGEDNKVYLIDFGAVQNQPRQAGATFTVAGTFGYTPIEQFGGQTCPASDLYALGATLVHLLTGTAPMDLPQDDFRLQFRDRLPNDLPQSWAAWLEKLTEPNVVNRPQSAAIALDELLALRRDRLRGTVKRPSAAPTLKQVDRAGDLNHHP